uniref:Endo/exonuclease/phosphatase domain-containing protein n=1 Tax=Macrostomum lignano TaxID=282301 RepID=A0A1I8FBZ3_9PLAT
SLAAAFAEVLPSLGADIVCLQETKRLGPWSTIQRSSPSAIAGGLPSGWVGRLTAPSRRRRPACATAPAGELPSWVPADSDDSVGSWLMGSGLSAARRRARLVLITVYCRMPTPSNEARMQFKMRYHRLLRLRADCLIRSGKHVIIAGDLKRVAPPHRSLRDGRGSADQRRRWRAGRPRLLLGRAAPVLPGQAGAALAGRGCWLPGSGTPHSLLTEASSAPSRTRTRTQIPTPAPLTMPTSADLSTHSVSGTRTGGTRTPAGAAARGRGRPTTAIGLTTCWPGGPAAGLRHPARVSGSDHCPVLAVLSDGYPLSAPPDQPLPSLAAARLPEFAARQRRISDFLAPWRGAQQAPKPPAKQEPPPASLKKRKQPQQQPAAKRRQASLSSFFAKPTPTPEVAAPAADSSVEKAAAESGSNGSVSASSASSTAASSSHQWRQLLTGPEKPPLCRGHGEACPAAHGEEGRAEPRSAASGSAEARGLGKNAEARCDTF